MLLCVLSDVLRARADWCSLEALNHLDDPRHLRAGAALVGLAEYAEAHAAGTSHESLRTLETQAAPHEATQGFPDLGAHASAYLEAFEGEPDDFAAVLGERAARVLLDAYEVLEQNTMQLRTYLIDVGDLATGYGLREHEAQAALEGVAVDVGYFAGERTANELAAKPRPEQPSAESARRPRRRSGRRRGRP